MFSNLQILITWILSSLTMAWTVILNNWGCIGVCIIGFPILRKLVSVFRKIF
jgi:hypothetical protein